MESLTDALRTILAVVGALLLAIFAKRYSDLKKKEAKLHQREIADEIKKTTDTNDSLPIDDLIERENARFRKE